MGSGLKLRNNSRELTFSSDARLPHCFGKMQLIQTVQPSGGVTSAWPGKTAGYSIYRMWSSAPVIPAFDLLQNHVIGILKVVQPASGVWDVYMHCGSDVDSSGFYTQKPLDVWGFGFADTPSNYGLVIRNRNGQLAADFLKPNILYPRIYINPSAPNQSQTINGLIRPVIIGVPSYSRLSSEFVPGSTAQDFQESMAMWNRNGAGSVQALMTTIRRYRSNTIGGAFEDVSGTFSSFLIEGALLP